MEDRQDFIEEILRRPDKWYLGGGQRVLWAPEFPLWLDHLGFWDHACYLDYAVQPLFTVSLVDPRTAREIKPRLQERSWVPSHLTQTYRAETFTLAEKRYLHPLDVLVSELSIKNDSPQKQDLRLVVWSCQPVSGGPSGPTVDQVRQIGDYIIFQRRYYRSSQLDQEYFLAFGANLPVTSSSMHLSEGTVNHPHWNLTPFYEGFRGELDNEKKIRVGVNPDGLLYLALCYPLVLEPGQRVLFRAGGALSPHREEALENLSKVMRAQDPLRESREQWQEFFHSVPYFSCSDPYFERYYWYRWYGLRLNRIEAKSERLPYPCVFEGTNVGWFRHHISYSAQCHMLECRWHHDPDLAQGSLLNFIANQREDGSFPGGILTGYTEQPTGFYHANWGKGVKALYSLHPEEGFLQQVYEPLKQYAQYFSQVRDKEGSHLYDVINQGETGQEYMSRYLFARENADDWGPIQLKGVDATVYLYELHRTLAWIAEKIGKTEEANHWNQEAEAIKKAILEKMWDPEKGFFVDVLPDGRRSPYKAAVGFYPFLTDIPGQEHLRALYDHLLNPEEFWTPWPVPSTSADDPFYSARGEWKGKRHSCPWNGRVWLMTNSHVTEALCRAAQKLDPSLKPKAVELLRKFIQMMFLDRDPLRPTSYEYYNPVTGQAPFFRGVDDYMHSWVVDLILQFVVGLQPNEGRLVVDPLDFGLEHFAVDRARIQGHLCKVEWREGKGLRVWVDGQLKAQEKELKRIEIPL